MEWYWILAIVLGSLFAGYWVAMYLFFLGIVEFWKELFNR